mmetsp:Transcript_92935/g.165263  ORF Transcript_92935/g.165263 Transcript_92935/m.165263 type:complete len:270 (-) Transcript_92935:126-935(-)
MSPAPEPLIPAEPLVQPEGSTTKVSVTPIPWYCSSSFWIVATTATIVAPMVASMLTGIIAAVADRVYVSFVLLVDTGMVVAVTYRTSMKVAANQRPDKAAAVLHKATARSRTQGACLGAAIRHVNDAKVTESEGSSTGAGKTATNYMVDRTKADQDCKGPHREAAEVHLRRAEFYLTFCHLLLPFELVYAVVFAQSSFLVAIGFGCVLFLIVQWLWREVVLGTTPCIMDDVGAKLPGFLTKHRTVFDAVTNSATAGLVAVGCWRLVRKF